MDYKTHAIIRNVKRSGRHRDRVTITVAKGLADIPPPSPEECRIASRKASTVSVRSRGWLWITLHENDYYLVVTWDMNNQVRLHPGPGPAVCLGAVNAGAYWRGKTFRFKLLTILLNQQNFLEVARKFGPPTDPESWWVYGAFLPRRRAAAVRTHPTTKMEVWIRL